MARRTLLWHIGLAGGSTPLDPVLHAHRDALADAGAAVVGTAEESLLATHELLRTAHVAGLRTRDVEGTWKSLTDRVWSHRGGPCLVSTSGLAVADKDELRLAMDALTGVEVHLVVEVPRLGEQLLHAWTEGLRGDVPAGWHAYAARIASGRTGDAQVEDFWAGHDLEALLSRWSWTMRPGRVHVLAQRDPADRWRALLDIAGLEPAGGLEAPVPPSGPTPPALPRSSYAAFRERAEGWARTLPEAGYDVRGNLVAALVEPEPEPADGAEGAPEVVLLERLGAALDDNAALRGRVAALERELARVQRKRKKLKRRLREAEQG